MSVVHMVACGLIDVKVLNGVQFRHVRKEVRSELRAKGLRLDGLNGFYQVLKRQTLGKRPKYALVFDGAFVNACKIATKIITPSHDEEI